MSRAAQSADQTEAAFLHCPTEHSPLGRGFSPGASSPMGQGRHSKSSAEVLPVHTAPARASIVRLPDDAASALPPTIQLSLFRRTQPILCCALSFICAPGLGASGVRVLLPDRTSMRSNQRPSNVLTVPLLTLYFVGDALAYHLNGVPSPQVKTRLDEMIAQRTIVSVVTGQTQLFFLLYGCASIAICV